MGIFRNKDSFFYVAWNMFLQLLCLTAQRGLDGGGSIFVSFDEDPPDLLFSCLSHLFSTLTAIHLHPLSIEASISDSDWIAHSSHLPVTYGLTHLSNASGAQIRCSALLSVLRLWRRRRCYPGDCRPLIVSHKSSTSWVSHVWARRQTSISSHQSTKQCMRTCIERLPAVVPIGPKRRSQRTQESCCPGVDHATVQRGAKLIPNSLNNRFLVSIGSRRSTL